MGERIETRLCGSGWHFPEIQPSAGSALLRTQTILCLTGTLIHALSLLPGWNIIGVQHGDLGAWLAVVKEERRVLANKSNQAPRCNAVSSNSLVCLMDNCQPHAQ